MLRRVEDARPELGGGGQGPRQRVPVAGLRGVLEDLARRELLGDDLSEVLGGRDLGDLRGERRVARADDVALEEGREARERRLVPGALAEGQRAPEVAAQAPPPVQFVARRGCRVDDATFEPEVRGVDEEPYERDAPSMRRRKRGRAGEGLRGDYWGKVAQSSFATLGICPQRARGVQMDP